LLSVPPSPWVPLLAGAAVATALRQVCDVDARLKWPNDVLIGEAKVGGILAEVVARAGTPSRVVIGIGLNVTTTASELQSGLPDLPSNRPVTSLRLAGASMTDRATILRAILVELGAERSRIEYEALCSTLGAMVTITLPGGGQVTGQATNLDDAGCIVVDGVSYAVGDVVHVR
jgi:BirA family biotin operon repressor/biotin-[acetyl-CoA-carboxylase] ligase